ncbi:ATP-binding protein [Treponema sp.]|uniref:ATP-binding protein n=1 Tax=Treponema sp. TaxID=166 RepID=UPI0025F23523|nr:ATP-binding protein [Treponema sp.]
MNRDSYLQKLVRRMHNGMVKVVTGIRRSGKTYLLFSIFYEYLLKKGIREDHIILVALDDFANKELRNPDALYQYVKSQITDEKMYYILLDEVQMVSEFEDVLNGFLHIPNADTYVTGSNAKFLSKDIITEFRGRGDQIHLYPLSFAEFFHEYDGSRESAWREYSLYGGLPKIYTMSAPQDKASYLESIFLETYLRDILERNDVRNPAELSELLDYLASGIGCLSNPKKLSDTFKSVKHVSIHPDTVQTYLGYFEDSFLISRAVRYDIKGKKYFNTPCKYYFSDIGLRNARLHFRQYEETHIMENIIYNELLIRGYSVDVGMVEHTERTANDKKIQNPLEVVFVCNKGYERLYIQSALNLPTAEKQAQEMRPLLSIKDSFKKLVIVGGLQPTYMTEDGVLVQNLFDFLLENDE